MYLMDDDTPIDCCNIEASPLLKGSGALQPKIAGRFLHSDSFDVDHFSQQKAPASGVVDSRIQTTSSLSVATYEHEHMLI